MVRPAEVPVAARVAAEWEVQEWDAQAAEWERQIRMEIPEWEDAPTMGTSLSSHDSNLSSQTTGRDCKLVLQADGGTTADSQRI